MPFDFCNLLISFAVIPSLRHPRCDWLACLKPSSRYLLGKFEPLSPGTLSKIRGIRTCHPKSSPCVPSPFTLAIYWNWQVPHKRVGLPNPLRLYRVSAYVLSWILILTLISTSSSDGCSICQREGWNMQVVAGWCSMQLRAGM